MEITKSFWCGPCSSGPFSIVASIPQSGYVPGQKIIVNTEITNMSNIPVDRMNFMIRKIIAYHSQTPSTKTKEEIVVIQERRAGGVPKKDHGRFQICLPIPPEPPTNTNLCKVIHITYEVKVEAKISGPHQSPYVRIPITVGTIPLNRNTPDPKTPVIQTSIAFAVPIINQPTFANDANAIMPSAPAISSPIISSSEYRPPEYQGPSTSQPITHAITQSVANTAYPDMRKFITIQKVTK